MNEREVLDRCGLSLESLELTTPTGCLLGCYVLLPNITERNKEIHREEVE